MVKSRASECRAILENLGRKWVPENEVFSREVSEAREASVLLFLRDRNFILCY